MLSDGESPTREVTWAISPNSVKSCVLGRNSFILQLKDLSCWPTRNIPAALHSKLHGRSPLLPLVKSVALAQDGCWIVIYQDGNFAKSSTFTLQGKLKTELEDPTEESPIKLFCFAPGGGWIILRENGHLAWERMPTGLDSLLSRRPADFPPVDHVTINSIGSWFVRFKDGYNTFDTRECDWESIPKKLEVVLIQEVRKGSDEIVVALSPSDPRDFLITIANRYVLSCDNALLEKSLKSSVEEIQNCEETSASHI